MQDLLKITSIQELNNALSQQQTMTRKALAELDEIGENVIADQTVPDDDEVFMKALHDAEMTFMRKYADRPTLTEFQAQPALRGMAREGGTFGVAAFTGEVLLSTVRGIEPRFVERHRVVMLLLLREVDDPNSDETDLVDPIVRFLRIQLNEQLDKLDDEQRKALVHGMCRPLVQVMLNVLMQYGVIEMPDEHGYILTQTGKRVFLHLFDVQKFMDTIAKAHKELQAEGATVAS